MTSFKGGDTDAEFRFDPDFWQQHWMNAGDRAIPANPYVGQVAASVEPGRALDVGCGAGNEAIALAGVTAVETSAAALDRAKKQAEDCTAEITWIHADASSWEPARGYDLVACSYVHTTLPQPQLLSRLAQWVNPGGRLLMVTHAPGDSHDHQQQGHGHEHGQPPAAARDAVDPLVSALDLRQWRVAGQEQTRRMSLGNGAERTLEDVVVLARRRH